MGNDTSYELPNIELAPLGKPVAAINARFCHGERLTLQPTKSTLSGTLRYSNVHTEGLRYIVRQATFTDRLTIYDGSEDAIANYASKTFSFKPVYYVHLGSEHEGDAVFEMHVEYNSDLKTEVHVSFTDLVTREPCELGFEGHWRKRTAYFWLDRGNSGVREPVAKVFCPEGASQSKCHIEIAPHMDTALITMVCAILSVQQGNEDMETIADAVEAFS